MSSQTTPIIQTPAYTQIQPKPFTSPFTLQPHYYKSILIYPQDDQYELDHQDQDFILIKNISPQLFISQIISLENQSHNSQSTPHIQILPEILAYWQQKTFQLGRSLLRKYMRAKIDEQLSFLSLFLSLCLSHVFRSQLQSKIQTRKYKTKYTLSEFNALRQIINLENQLLLKLLKSIIIREKLKHSILFDKNHQALINQDSHLILLKRLHQLKSRAFHNLQCTNQSCIYDQFKSLPITYLCPEIIDYVGQNYRSLKNRQIKIPFPSQPTVLRGPIIDPSNPKLLAIREHNQQGVQMDKTKIVIGASNKTLIIQSQEQIQNDETEVKISLINGRQRRTNISRIQFQHMMNHCAEYKKKEKIYIKQLRDSLHQEKVNIIVDIQDTDTSNVYVEI